MSPHGQGSGSHRGRWRLAALAALLCLVAAAGICAPADTLAAPDWSWSRMIEQPRLDPYQASALFADGRGMRVPPAGSVGRDDLDPDQPLITGIAGGEYLAVAPIPIDAAALERGHHDFDAFCACCHGLTGDGSTLIAARMTQVRPRDLLDPQRRGYPVGRLVAIMTRGYGLMASYAVQLDPAARWGVASYLKVLQLSQYARLDQLPAPLRDAFRRAQP